MIAHLLHELGNHITVATLSLENLQHLHGGTLDKNPDLKTNIDLSVHSLKEMKLLMRSFKDAQNKKTE